MASVSDVTKVSAVFAIWEVPEYEHAESVNFRRRELFVVSPNRDGDLGSSVFLVDRLGTGSGTLGEDSQRLS